MLTSFKLIEEKETEKEKGGTYLCLFKLTINDNEIIKITIIDHTGRKLGRENITNELILNIFKEKLNDKRLSKLIIPKERFLKGRKLIIKVRGIK